MSATATARPPAVNTCQQKRGRARFSRDQDLTCAAYGKASAGFLRLQGSYQQPRRSPILGGEGEIGRDLRTGAAKTPRAFSFFPRSKL